MKIELPIQISKYILKTPLGNMIAISDDHALHLLQFVEQMDLEREIERFQQKTNSVVTKGKTRIHDSIENELNLYFNNKLREFKTPLAMYGTQFQKNVWSELTKIPFGTTFSYTSLAHAIKMPTACRAVGNANGANQLAIIIPCHRVINSNGKLGGYAGGLERKKWLLDHENKNVVV